MFIHKAADFLGLIKSLNLKDNMNTEEKKLFDILTQWDYQYLADLEGPVLFDLFYRLSDNTWDEIDALRKEMNVGFPNDWRLLDLMISEPSNKYFDHKGTKMLERCNRYNSQIAQRKFCRIW